jgi:hypothetical protein
VTHSAGGLIGELLARGQRIGPLPPFDEADYALCAEHPDDELALRQLSRVLADKRLRIERFVCVAAPLRGSEFFTRAVARSSAILNFIPFADSAIGALLRYLTDPKRVPGLAAMYPNAPLMRLLNRSEVVTEADLAIVSGTTEQTTLLRRIGEFIFSARDTDLLFESSSMVGGAGRVLRAYHAHFAGPTVNHFTYFSHPGVVAAILQRLQRDPPDPPWRPLSAEEQSVPTSKRKARRAPAD